MLKEVKENEEGLAWRWCFIIGTSKRSVRGEVCCQKS